jgi:Leucine-rich repeat (LRR) protein
MDTPNMNIENDKQYTSSKKIFLLAHSAYMVIWIGILIYVYKIFGVGYMNGLLLLASIPFFVSLRMLWKWDKQKKRDFIALGIVVASVFIATPFVINDWDSKGMDKEHASDVGFFEFSKIVRSKPAFRAIGCHERGRKGGHWISGEVFSEEDFEQLKALTEKYEIGGIEEIGVITHLKKQLPSLKTESILIKNISTNNLLVNSPDNAINSVIQNILKSNNQDFKQEDLNKITVIDLRMSTINKLTGIKKLDELYATHNKADIIQITDLNSLKRLPNLRILYLDDSLITDLSFLSPLKELKQLQFLHLDGNQITDLSPLSKLVQLKVLFLRGNQISKLHGTQNINGLLELRLDNNRIKDLRPLSKMKHLKVLTLRNNSIVDLRSISDLPNLYRLDLRDNQISDISPLKNLLNGMRSLYLTNNPITDLTPLEGYHQKLSVFWKD